MSKKLCAVLLGGLLSSGQVSGQESWNPPIQPPPGGTPALVTGMPDLEETSGRAIGTGTWASLDILSSWVRGMRLPPLVTTSPQGTTQDIAGLLGSPSTQVLFGANGVDGAARVGVRFGLGAWLDEDRSLGIEVGYSTLETVNASFNQTSNGDPILDRPFFGTGGAPNGLLIGFPGASTGSVQAAATSTHFQSAFLDLRESVVRTPGYRIDSILGYRYFRFDERLSISDTFVPTNVTQFNVIPGTTIQNNDFFGTRNEFHGGEFGVRTEFFFQRWSADFLGKIAVGKLHRNVNINGQSTFTVPGADPVNFNAGLLALADNSGTHASNDWVVAPELGVNVNWEISGNLKLRFGYSFLLLSNIARPGDQVDLNINQSFLPGGTPAGAGRTFIVNRTDVYVHTFNAGLVFSY